MGSASTGVTDEQRWANSILASPATGFVLMPDRCGPRATYDRAPGD